MNNKLIVGGIVCDLEKAFDCVNHNILLAKLKFNGTNGRDCAFYESYMENRYKRTALYNEQAACKEVSSRAKR